MHIIVMTWLLWWHILLNEKSYKNLLISDVVYKTLYDSKPLHIIFDKVDGYIRKYDGTKYLALFHSDENYESFW